MWEMVFEWCAEMFGVTVESKLGQLVLFSLSLFVLGVVLSMRWGLEGFVAPMLIIGLAALAARQVAAARNEVWRAACAALGEVPRAAGRLVAPTAAALARLAEAVRSVRRAEYTAASDLVPQIDRRLLRPEELQLLDAVRAMISAGLGSTDRAARQAVAALPTGSEELDTCLGRTVVSEAWNDPARLTAIQSAWDRAGVRRGPLSRLSTLVRIRLDENALDAVPHPEARELSDEARAIGDDALAAELDARSRSAAYR